MSISVTMGFVFTNFLIALLSNLFSSCSPYCSLKSKSYQTPLCFWSFISLSPLISALPLFSDRQNPNHPNHIQGLLVLFKTQIISNTRKHIKYQMSCFASSNNHKYLQNVFQITKITTVLRVIRKLS